MIWNCGMDEDCINRNRIARIIYTETGVHALHPKLGTHDTYEDAQHCVHSQDPQAWKKLNIH